MKNEYEVRGDVTAIFLNHKGKRYETLIDTADLSKAQEFPNTWFLSAKPEIDAYYVVGREIKNTVNHYTRLHRWLMDTPEGMDVDHINHNGLDNRRSVNLQNVPVKLNQQNRRGAQRNNLTSGIRGVSFNKNTRKWKAYIKVDGKFINLGEYKDIDQAESVVKEARSKYMENSREALAN